MKLSAVAALVVALVVALAGAPASQAPSAQAAKLTTKCKKAKRYAAKRKTKKARAAVKKACAKPKKKTKKKSAKRKRAASRKTTGAGRAVPPASAPMPTPAPAPRQPAAPAPATPTVAPAAPAAPATPTPDVPASTPATPSVPSSPTRTGPRWFGFHDNGIRFDQISPEEDGRLTKEAGGNASRITLDWRWIELEPGKPRWGEYDAIYKGLLAHGVKPIWTVVFAPHWAWEPGVLCNQWASDCRYPPGREHLDDWASFVAQVARRYPESAAIQVWNEPNLASFWRSGPNPEQYTALLRSAYRAVRSVDAGMPVVGGSIGNNQYTRNGNISLSDFLTGMYRYGAKGYMDAVAFHPYPWADRIDVDGVFTRSFSQVRAARAAAGDEATPLWVTETGVSTSGTDLRYRYSEQQQADIDVALVRAITAMPDVDALLLHTLVEPPFSLTSIEYGYGTVRQNLQPKPAYCAIARERGATGCDGDR